MKYTILILTLVLSFLSAKDNTTYVKVDGMQCSYSCAGKVNSVVQKIDGVRECTVDFDKGIPTVVFDDKKLETKDIVEGLKSNTANTMSECTKKQDKQEPAQI